MTDDRQDTRSGPPATEPQGSAVGRPGRPGITFEQYEAAYHELVGADGRPPSQRQIRRYLGSGSNSTLSGYRRRIAEQRLADQQPPEPHSLDAALLETVTRLVTQLSTDAAQVADDRVEEIRTSAQSRVDRAEKIVDKVQRDTALLKHRAERAESDLATARRQIEAGQRRIDEARAQVTALEAGKQTLAHELELRQRTLDVAKLTSASVTEERDVARRELVQRDERVGELETALRVRDTELARRNETVAVLETRCAERDRRVEQYEEQVRALTARVESVEAAREVSAAQRDALTEQLSSARAELASLQAQLLAERRAHESTTEQARTQLAEKGSTIEQLQRALTTVTDLGRSSESPGDRP